MVKKCSKCNIEKPLTEFHKNIQSPDGYHWICKPCNLEKRRIWYALNRNAALENKKEYYKNKKVNILSYNKRRYQNKRNEIIEKNKNNYKKNASIKKSKQKTYRKVNKEVINAEARKKSKELHDNYIKKSLRNKGFTDSIIKDNPELILSQKELLKIKRYVKEKTGKKYSGA